MSTTLSRPTYHQDPTEVAPGTYVIHEVQHALGQPISVFINSAVIDGDEPVLIDTGSLRNRQAWLKDTFDLVDPKRIKWVFISHEDADHVGNLDQVMEACPNANVGVQLGDHRAIHQCLRLSPRTLSVDGRRAELRRR